MMATEEGITVHLFILHHRHFIFLCTVEVITIGVIDLGHLIIIAAGQIAVGEGATITKITVGVDVITDEDERS
jgi:hypothetical protein